MPEVNEQPITYDIIEKNLPFGGNERAYEKRDWAALRQHFMESKARRLRENPDKRALIEAVYGFMFNVFLVPEGADKAEDQDTKRIAACIQQNVVHCAYYASTDHAGEVYALNVYRNLMLSERLARLSQRPGVGSEGPIFLSGIKNELAVVKALKGNKINDGSDEIELWIPNYVQDPKGLKPIANEVLQLDIEHGVDMIAIVPRNDGARIAIMINSTGRMDIPEVGVVDRSGRYVMVTPFIREMLYRLGADDVRRADVRIPSRRLMVDWRKPFTLPDDVRRAVREYGDLDTESKYAIIQGIKEIAETRSNR